MLKATAYSIAPSITKLFNLSIQLGCFPQTWKVSNVVPIPKSTDNTSPNYRPISLLSVLSKLLERHMYCQITDHLETHHPLSSSQWGFHSWKATITALLETTHNWYQLMDAGKEIGAVFFDLKKAFDAIPHRALLDILRDLHLNEFILKWICDYLTQRKQRVVVNGQTSETLPVLSGVPQGSVIGPLLFFIYIDGVTSVPLSVGSQLTVYAYDILLYRPISCQSDFAALQDDINKLDTGVNTNYLQFNTSKCKYMVVSRKISDITSATLIMQGHHLERVECLKYLGLLLSTDLSWTAHVESVCSKARKLLGLLYRKYYQYAEPQILLQLYISLVRPHLEYASPVWNPYLQKNINTLEEVQKFALRMCSKQRDQAYSQLLQLFNIPTLSECRLYLDLCTMFKVVHDYLNFLLAFWTHIMAELQALTGHFCFIDPSPAITIIIILLFPIQSLHGTPYQLHLYLIVYLFLEVMYGCISHVTIAILCILCWSA